MNRTLTQAIAILALLTTINLHGQVTIGSNQPPVAGALLDLKEDGTTKKGLGLPRVELQSYKKLKMGTAAEITGSLATEHAGLIVYNTLDQPECGTPAGLFVWEGAQWMQLSGKQVDLGELGSYEEDVQALKDLYNANPGNTLGWNLAADPSTFVGVTWASICGEQRVIALSVDSKNLTSATGIEKLYLLENLSCMQNQLTILDVSNNIRLKDLWCHNNQLINLNVSRNSALRHLGCAVNFLTNIDVSHNTALRIFHCNNNQLANIDLSHNIELEDFSCHSNQLATLDISNNIVLKRLDCGLNPLINLSISNNAVLEYLDCSYNELAQSEVNKFKLHPNYCPNFGTWYVVPQYFTGTTTVDWSITAPGCP